MDTNYSQDLAMDSLDKVHHILIVEDPSFVKEISLEAATYSIGRHSSNDIALSCQKTSRHHATLLKRTDAKTNQYSYWILDGDLQGNRSRNGIYVNGKKTLVHELKHDDVVQFSGNVLTKYKITNQLQNESSESFSFNLKDRDFDRAAAKNPTIGKEIVTPEQNSKNGSLAPSLASLAELSPQSIIETDLYGNITYINLAGIVNFKDIHHRKLNHPLFEDLISKFHYGKNNIITREIEIKKKLYQQTAQYLPEKKAIINYVTDISKYQNRIEELQQNESLYQQIIHQVTEGILIIDSATKQIIEANSICSNLLGYSNSQLLQMNIYELVDESEKFAIILRKVIAERHSFWGGCLLRGKQYPATSDINDIRRDGLRLCRGLGSLSQNNNLIDAQLKIDIVGVGSNDKIYLVIHNLATRKYPLKTEQNSSIDLSHRKNFNQQLFTAIANAKRSQQLLAVMFCQLNLSPDIRNSIGAEQSDRLLLTSGERLTACLRFGDAAIRWQEDIFAILLPQVNDIEEVARIEQRIHQSIGQSFTLNETQTTIDCHIGIAIYPQDGVDAEVLLKSANTALLRAVKINSHYQFYDEAINSQALVALELEVLLQQALLQEEFELYYQPQIDINSGNITAMEALLRWQHSELGLVAPGNFLRSAEKTKLIIPIGEWTIRVACMQNKQWQEQGLASSKIIVSLSLVQFKQPNLAQKIAEILTETGLEPCFLELEISAASLIDNVADSRDTIEKLKAIGVQIAVDGFTTGFSMVEYLKHFSLDTLKIDRHLVEQLTKSPQDLAIVTAAIELAKGFELKIVAEGVENQEQVDLLHSLNCYQMQGYWFSHPLSAEEASKLLELDNSETNNIR